MRIFPMHLIGSESESFKRELLPKWLAGTTRSSLHLCARTSP